MTTRVIAYSAKKSIEVTETGKKALREIISELERASKSGSTKMLSPERSREIVKVLKMLK